MPNTAPEAALHVVAGVLRNDRGQVLITQRLPHAHQGGKWEFPGGKCEINEAPVHALRRELREELGIEVGSVEPRIQIAHDYEDRRVFLDVFDILTYRGEPHGLEGQALQWVLPGELKQFDYPAANLPVITSLMLPTVYVITGLEKLEEEAFFSRLDTLLNEGIRLFQFRAHELSRENYLRIARRFVRRAHEYDAKVLLNTEHEEDVIATDADGIHLNSRQLQERTRRPLPSERLVAASCHNAEELKRAELLHLDFTVLSPVRHTSSHPQHQPLGWDRFSELVAPGRIPVYALGGMKFEDVSVARQHGAQGVALLGAAWQPERSVR